jgi:NRAMP (natural resistance-associated macrophage protein)-like metal ion transporter
MFPFGTRRASKSKLGSEINSSQSSFTHSDESLSTHEANGAHSEDISGAIVIEPSTQDEVVSSRPMPSRLANLRRRFPRRSNIALYLAVMGPGLIAALAGNDAGGIGTYSFAGARYGYKLLWLLFIITFALALVQEMAARMGAVTQKGLGELIRENYGVGWTLFALGVMFVGNTATTIAEFAGIAAAGEIFGLSKYFTVPLAALLMWLLVAHGPFRLVERIFLAICLVQLTYVFAAFRAVSTQPADQGWPHILSQLVRPSWESDPHFILLCIGVVGTTIAPWMQFFLQSTVVDKGIAIGEYRYQKADVYAGALATDIIAFFIIVCTAAALYRPGVNIDPNAFTAGEAARALSLPLGEMGKYVFAMGLLAASLLAAAVLPLSTAYTYCESFGWEIGVQRKPKEAPMFYGIFTATLVLSALVVLLPNVPLIYTMLLSQNLNGMLLPVVLIFMLKLVNNKRIMGEYSNNSMQNMLAWSTVVFLILLTIVLLGSSVWEMIRG